MYQVGRLGDPMEKLNCWEFMKCGKESGGSKAEELGVCPASVYSQADAANGGRSGGRICWAIAGTLCGGKPIGMFVPKIVNCLNCRFYKKVAEDEGSNLQFMK